MSAAGALRRIVALCGALALLALTGHASAAISYRTSGSNGVTAGSLSLTIPVGTGEGDLMVAIVSVRQRSVVQVTKPGGWTDIAATQTGSGGNEIVQLLQYRLVTAGDVAAAGASWTWSWAGTRNAAGVILVFRGVDPSNPVEASAQQAEFSGPDQNTITIPSVDVTGTGRMLVGAASTRVDAAIAWAAPMTEAAERRVSSLTVSGAYEATAVTGGPTGTRVATAGANGVSRVGGMVALRPAALAAPRAYWKFDEGGYGGTTGEVIDASGNGLHMQAFNGATTTAIDAKFCRSAEFTGNAARRYLQIGDNALLDIPDRLTITAWIRPASWPGSGLMSIASKDENYEFHVATSGRINWWWTGGANQIFTGNNAAPINTWTHVALVYTRGAQEIYINGVRAANNWANPDRNLLAQNSDPFQIGQDQGFAGRYFDGLIDDFRIYAAALSEADVQAIYAENPTCPVALDHLSISHSGGGVACADETVTITAHDASHAAVDAGGVAIALSTTNGKGTWSGIVAGGGVLSDPIPGDGAAIYTFAPGSSAVQLSLRYADLATTSETFGFDASGGGVSETSGAATAADDPPITFAQAGFRFRNATDGTTIIPTQIAGKPSNVGWNAKTLRIQAIRTDTQTGACVGLFANQSRTIELGAECNDPAVCAGAQVTVNGGPIATSSDDGGAGAAAYTGHSLAFDAASEAETVIAYPDAGRVSLHGRYDLDPAIAGFEMRGASNPFVVRPFGFRISGVPSGVSGPASAVFRRAGEGFGVTLTAVAWKSGDDADADGMPDSQAQVAGNAATPGFGQEAGPATATVSHALAEPAGGAAGALSNTSFTGFAAGARAQTTSYSEVGIVDLFATSENYLASGENVTAGAGGLTGVGRFIPDHFALSGGVLANRAAGGCAPASAFTYMNEALALRFTLTARSAAGATTTNYRGAFARLDLASPASFVFGARDVAAGTNLTTRIDTALGTSGAWANGVAANVQATLAIVRSNPDDPDGPFEQVKLGIAPSDPDGVALAASALDFSTTGGANDRAQAGADTRIRFGRLRLTSAFGSGTRGAHRADAGGILERSWFPGEQRRQLHDAFPQRRHAVELPGRARCVRDGVHRGDDRVYERRGVAAARRIRRGQRRQRRSPREPRHALGQRVQRGRRPRTGCHERRALLPQGALERDRRRRHCDDQQRRRS
ncbi:MAG: LamG domain-containing protein [Burkholderiales bacterium]|nr:LamG domain-containing protein [Burkholderiales bacterium]